MNNLQDTNHFGLFPVRKQRNPASLTQDEVTAIIRLADSLSLSDVDKAKLLLSFRERKKAAYAKKKGLNH